MTIRLVFFGNSQSPFSNQFFQAFLASPAELVAVVDVPPARRTSTNAQLPEETADFVTIARQRGVPAFEPVNPNAPESVTAMRNLMPDLLAAVGYTNLLKDELLAVPSIAATNFHASLLPAYRGKHPVFWALRHGESYSGLTIHLMDRELDKGGILYQVKVPTRRTDSVNSLYERIMTRSLGLVDKLIADAEADALTVTPQPATGASYFSSVSEEDFYLNWAWPAEQLRRYICTTPGQCFADFAGRRLYPLDAQVKPNEDGLPPGTLIRIGKTCCTVAAGDGGLRIRRAKETGTPDGAMSMSSICRQLNLQPGVSIV